MKIYYKPKSKLKVGDIILFPKSLGYKKNWGKYLGKVSSGEYKYGLRVKTAEEYDIIVNPKEKIKVIDDEKTTMTEWNSLTFGQREGY